ncbi:MAG: hypothetical protein K2O63_05420 [Alistipes sp.]|nr:hypothetical protein [Alistipes sp.]
MKRFFLTAAALACLSFAAHAGESSVCDNPPQREYGKTNVSAACREQGVTVQRKGDDGYHDQQVVISYDQAKTDVNVSVTNNSNSTRSDYDTRRNDWGNQINANISKSDDVDVQCYPKNR